MSNQATLPATFPAYQLTVVIATTLDLCAGNFSLQAACDQPLSTQVPVCMWSVAIV